MDEGKARKIVADFEKMDDLLVELLDEECAQEPDEIILDVGATGFERHGAQVQRLYVGSIASNADINVHLHECRRKAGPSGTSPLWSP